jgi:hypothetical protein
MVIPQAPIVLLFPNPAGGGVVGLTKVSDGNSPLPRDRIIFDYDYFDSVPLSAGGVAVNRFSPGFEWTFFDQRASLEVRVPFASTLSSDILADGVTNSSRVELGDVHLTLKGLAYRSETLAVAAGLGIDVPTADNVKLLQSDGTPLLQIRNDAVILTPYFAYLWTPNDRVFFQNWYQVALDSNGNLVDANLNMNGLQTVGRITQQGILEIDAQLGYWLYQASSASSLVNRVAPFIELHYNSSVGNADTVQAGGLTVGLEHSHFDELNMGAGFLAQVNNRFLLSVGAQAPLKGQADRSFDWQVGIRGSILFGPTLRNATRATPVSSF